MNNYVKSAIYTVIAVCLALPAMAQDAGDKKAEADPPIPDPISFTTSHSGRFNGTTVRYRAVAGETYIRGEDGKPSASFFTTAYLAEGVDDPAERPVTFIYNGGPGSASLWLHMGVFGPKRVVISSDPEDDGAPPYPIVDNTETFLDVTDMVFIDPIGTGYSRPLGKHEGKEFWGVMEDVNSIAKFIHTWIDQNQRWNSPKYLAGESYGTLRSAALSDVLTSGHNISLNGIVLISAVLDYQNSRFQHGALMSYVSFLPTFAATAWYHNKLPNRPDELAPFLAEVREFARGDYLQALAAGERLTEDERSALIDRLHAYTGLKKSYLDDANMRVMVFRFFKELLRDEGKVIGRLDGRYLGVEVDDVGEFFEADPSSYGIGGAFTAAINVHFGQNLAISMDRDYQTRGNVRPWNWKVGERAPNGGRYINMIPNLGRAMRQNNEMRVLVTSGYFDFATPFFGAENALAEAGIPQDRVEFTYYEAGHMMYLHAPSRAKFLADVRAFIVAGGE